MSQGAIRDGVQGIQSRDRGSAASDRNCGQFAAKLPHKETDRPALTEF
ncbi:MAG TPA: hypothetical protein V6C65_41530 [Allocoleopsis sp.]